MSDWYISFATDDGFLGAAVVEADTLPDALTRTCLLGINPGGEAMLIEVPAGTTDGMPSEFRDVLLSRADLDALDGMLGAT